MKHTAWHYLIFGLLLAWMMLNNNAMQRKLDQGGSMISWSRWNKSCH